MFGFQFWSFHTGRLPSPSAFGMWPNIIFGGTFCSFYKSKPYHFAYPPRLTDCHWRLTEVVAALLGGASLSQNKNKEIIRALADFLVGTRRLLWHRSSLLPSRFIPLGKSHGKGSSFFQVLMTWEDESSTSLISASTRVLGRDDSFGSHYFFSLNPIRGEEGNSFHIAIIFSHCLLFCSCITFIFHLIPSSHYLHGKRTTIVSLHLLLLFFPVPNMGRELCFLWVKPNIYMNFFFVPNFILQLSLPHLIRSCSLP